jgi:hypothetical protein
MNAGCSRPPQVNPDQIRLVEATWTAVSGKDLKALDSVMKLADTEHQSGRLTDHQWSTFQDIFQKTQVQNWQSAEDSAFEFLHAQGP